MSITEHYNHNADATGHTPDDICANGRRHPGGGMDHDWYSHDMSDDEWYGDDE